VSFVRSFLLITLLQVILCSTGICQQKTFTTQDSIAARTLYAESKKEFLAFEKDHGHFILTNNVNMHYLTWGKPGSPALVWIHGTYSNGYEISELADSLVKKGLYVIAIDYYGHGLTPFPKKEVSLFHVADDIRFLLDHLKIKKAIVGGWSRGGAIATAFYDAYPESVSALILEDGGSVPWSINDHKKQMDTLIKETRNQYKDRKPQRKFDSEFAAFYGLYKYYLHDKTGSHLRKEMFIFLARVKELSVGVWKIDPDVPDFVCLATADQLLTLKSGHWQATRFSEFPPKYSIRELYTGT
jgi:pimeloyl-ACP methyl ester carboxylesterase